MRSTKETMCWNQLVEGGTTWSCTLSTGHPEDYHEWDVSRLSDAMKDTPVRWTRDGQRINTKTLSDRLRTNIDFFRSGIYLHYKGDLYEATHLSHAASRDNAIEVAYIGLSLPKGKDGPRHATREFDEFFQFVHISNGQPCDRYELPCTIGQPRFKFLGPMFEQWMVQQAVLQRLEYQRNQESA